MRVTSTSASGPRASMAIFCGGAGAGGGAAAAWTATSDSGAKARANAASFIGVRAKVYAKPLPAR